MTDHIERDNPIPQRDDLEIGHKTIDGQDWTVIAARDMNTPGQYRANSPTYEAHAGEHIIAQGIFVDATAGSAVISDRSAYVRAEEGSTVTARNGGRVDALAGSHVDIQALGEGNAEAGASMHVGDGGKANGRADSEIIGDAGSQIMADKGTHVIANSGSTVWRAAAGAAIDAQLGAHLIDIDPAATVNAPRGIDLSYFHGYGFQFVPDGAKVNTSELDSYQVTMATPGSDVTAAARSQVIAEKDSTVHALAGANVIATPGSHVTAEFGSSVIQIGGADVTRNPGAHVVDVDASRYAGQQFDDHIANDSFPGYRNIDGKQLFYYWRDGETAPRGTHGEASWGNITAGPGSYLTAIRQAKVLAQADSNVDAQGGSTVDAQSGSLVTARAYSHVTARVGSAVTAESDSVITADKGAIVKYEDSAPKRFLKDYDLGWTWWSNSPSEQIRADKARQEYYNRHMNSGAPQ